MAISYWMTMRLWSAPKGRKITPSFWAQMVKAHPWACGKRKVRTPGSLLNQLRKLGLKREATLKERAEAYTVERFRNLVGSRRANIEAMHAQAVGESLADEQMCLHCQQGHGIYDACVVVPELHDGMQECANCHHGQQGRRCSFRKVENS